MPKEILIVEDDADMQLFYKEILKGEDYNITFASSGKESSFLPVVPSKRFI